MPSEDEARWTRPTTALIASGKTVVRDVLARARQRVAHLGREEAEGGQQRHEQEAAEERVRDGR